MVEMCTLHIYRSQIIYTSAIINYQSPEQVRIKNDFHINKELKVKSLINNRGA